jgi:penicillin-binding protein 1A
VGLTPDFVAGVWMGFDRPRTITPLAFGGTLAAPIWAAFAASVYSVRPIPPAWQPPPGLVALRVRRSDGSPAPQDTTDATCTEYFLGGTEPAGRGAAERLLRRLRLALFGW